MILHVLFDGPPGAEAGRFIEVETPDGHSVKAGEWIDKGDGKWALELDVLAPEERDMDDFSTSSGVALRDGRPFIAIHWQGAQGQVSPDTMREVAAQCFQVAEAAELDAALFNFLTKATGVDVNLAARMLGDLRIFRGEQPDRPGPDTPEASTE